MPANPSFDELVSTTLQEYRPTLQENILTHEAFWFTLKSKGGVKEEDGSRSIVVPLLYGTNSTVKSYSGYDIIDTTPQAGISAAEYEWKQLAGTVTISGEEEAKNSGRKTQVIDLLKAKVLQLEKSFQKELNRLLFLDGTGNGGKDITGLGLAVEDGAAWSTYGGIDRALAANAFWRNKWKSFAGTSFGTTSGKSIEGLDEFRAMYNNVSVARMSPDLIVTTQGIFEAYEAYMEGQKQRIVNTKLADAGFNNLEYKGVPIVWDPDVPANTVFFLNLDTLGLRVVRGRNLVSRGFQNAINQDAKVSMVLFMAQLVTSRSDANGRIGGLTV